MSDAKALLLSLSQKGIDIRCKNGEIHIQAPKGGLLPQELNAVRVLKGEIIRLLAREEYEQATQIQARKVDCPIPLTTLQKWFWEESLACGTRRSCRVSSFALRIVGTLNVVCLQSSVEELLRRHESLRTTFITVDGVPRQCISAPGRYRMECIDVEGSASESAEERARVMAHELMGELIDVSKGPLFETKLLRLSDSEYVFIIALDHLITDGFSWELLNDEILKLYNHFEYGSELELPCLSIQLPDYAIWQQQTHRAWRERHEAYWVGRFANAPRLNPIERDPLLVSKEPLTSRIWFSSSHELRRLAKRVRVDISLVLYSIFIAAVSRWCDQMDIALSVLVNGRWCSELQNMVGWLVNLLHIRVRVAPGESFLKLLEHVATEYYSAYEHQDFNRVPDLIPGFTCDVGVAHWPFERELYFASEPHQWFDRNRRIRIEAFHFDRTLPPEHRPLMIRALDRRLYFSSRETAAGMEGVIWANAGVCSQETIKVLGENIRTFAESISQYPRASVESIAFQSGHHNGVLAAPLAGPLGQRAR